MEYGIIGAIIATVGALAGLWGQHKTNQTNKELASQAQQFEQSMVNQQNAYNSPSQQMLRYQQAGLNPNLIYGTGSSSAGLQTGRPSAHIPQIMNEFKDINMNSTLGLLSQYQDWQVKKAQIDNLQSATNLNHQKMSLTNSQDLLTLNKATIAGLESGKLGMLASTQVEYLKEKMKEEVNLLRKKNTMYDQQISINPEKLKMLDLTNKLKGYELEMNSSLKPFNMTAQDEIWARLFAKILKESSKSN